MVNRSLNVRQGRTDSKHPVLSLVCSINTLLYKKLSSFFLHLYLIPSLRVPWTTAGLLNKTFGGCSCGASSKPGYLFYSLLVPLRSCTEDLSLHKDHCENGNGAKKRQQSWPLSPKILHALFCDAS